LYPYIADTSIYTCTCNHNGCYVVCFISIGYNVYQMNSVNKWCGFFLCGTLCPPANTYYNRRKLFIVNTSTVVDTLQYLERCGICVLVKRKYSTIVFQGRRTKAFGEPVPTRQKIAWYLHILCTHYVPLGLSINTRGSHSA